MLRIIDIHTYDILPDENLEYDTTINGGMWLAAMLAGAWCWAVIIKCSLLGLAAWTAFRVTQ